MSKDKFIIINIVRRIFESFDSPVIETALDEYDVSCTDVQDILEYLEEGNENII